MFDPVSRRDALRAGLAGAVGAAALGVLGCARGDKTENPREAALTPSGARRVCRVAHLTDMHTQPEKGAGEGTAAAFAHASSLSDRPDLVITGGDSIFDGFERDRSRVATQWGVWAEALKACRVPVRSVLGNHDVWGWNRSKSGTSGNEPGWGKAWGIEALGMPGRFYALDLPRVPGARAGWRALMLDSVRPKGDGYEAFIDPEQLEWLKGELAAAAAPGGPHLLVVSHVPILSAAVFMQAKPSRRVDINGGLMHADAQDLKTLFAASPSVRACVSGHLHLVDDVTYNGVRYLCDGAVCAAWWNGRYVDCDEGYAVLDLYDDGTLRREYVKYGWTARA
jgi:3',5'-cyclic AMP phosphodiesterase CpdA